jgi:hypothetical protein
MESEEHNLQGKLKKVLVAMEIKRTDFDNIRQDVNKIKKDLINSPSGKRPDYIKYESFLFFIFILKMFSLEIVTLTLSTCRLYIPFFKPCAYNDTCTPFQMFNEKNNFRLYHQVCVHSSRYRKRFINERWVFKSNLNQ